MGELPPVDPMGPPPVVTRDEAAARAMHLLSRMLCHRRAGESVKGAIVRAAGLAGFDPERTREMWYGRAVVMAHEAMQLEARVIQRDARVARLVARLAGIAGEPGAPTKSTQLGAVLDHERMDAAMALADLVPGAEGWARSLSAGGRALVLACLLSLLPSLFFAHPADARTVKRGGPAAVKMVKGGARAGGPGPGRVPLRWAGVGSGMGPGMGVRHA